jgi:hypothetical protein
MMVLPAHKLQEVDLFVTETRESLFGMTDEITVQWKPRSTVRSFLGLTWEAQVRERPLSLRFKRTLGEDGMYRMHPACAALLGQLNAYVAPTASQVPCRPTRRRAEVTHVFEEALARPADFSNRFLHPN